MRLIYLIILALLLNIFLVYKYKKLERQKNYNITRMDNIIQLYHNKLLTQVENGNIIDVSSIVGLNDIEKGESLQSVVNSQKLIFRFTELNCMACVEHEIPILKEIGRKLGEKNIIILASYEKPSTLEILKKRWNLKFKIYNVELSSISDNQIESLNVPYFFVLTKSMLGVNLFIPEKALPLLTKDYLNFVAKKL